MDTLTPIEKKMVELAQSKLDGCIARITAIENSLGQHHKQIQDAIDCMNSVANAFSATMSEEVDIKLELPSMSEELGKLDAQFKITTSKYEAALLNERTPLAIQVLTLQHFNSARKTYKDAKKTLYRKRARLSHLRRVESEQEGRYDNAVFSLGYLLDNAEHNFVCFEKELESLWDQIRAWRKVASAEELAGYEAGVGKVRESAKSDVSVRNWAEQVFVQAHRELNETSST
ncbi:hypothetical protein MAPG_01264 [Magnaporthiopsis poae ATCC 64411]|uniref:Uncharacterized protein n=1 Tax=Magnaporthiopsis poae (strain ATCC 64411 / 73-15) TaxID=644358 RepID=A0A0C4DN85_MAGP6|nr:hypothetical protein MAPG_01264 [Magnaporthiopsis poae ATCC 64411]